VNTLSWSFGPRLAWRSAVVGLSQEMRCQPTDGLAAAPELQRDHFRLGPRRWRANK
jgi:hypothetical protein